MFRFFAAVPVGLLGATLAPGLNSPARAEQVLAIGAPLAATGAEAREGALAKQGYDLWADTVNARGGIKVTW
jgi:branched-chain amino acid transport system substrate-binding protein